MNARDDVEATPLVRVDTHGPVRTITLNRGARYNALSQAMIGALDDALQTVAVDPSVRVVVLAADGRGFCAGHDLVEMNAHPSRDWQEAVFAACNRTMMRLTELPQPVIARVHGLATAAGCQLVSMCDLAVAAEEARFGLPGVNIGVFCSTPAVGVARNIGRKRTMEMLLTGEPIDAPTALAWGLVNAVVPAGDLDAAVARYAKAIASKSAAVVSLGKRAFYRQLDRPMAGAYTDMAAVMVDNLREPHAAEGIAAFVAKRPPDFSS